MNLTPEQKQTVVSWVAAGDGLSAVQSKLREQFQLSLTYRDVRFLVDDLDLQLKDAAPKVDTSDVTKAVAPAPSAPAPQPPGTGGDEHGGDPTAAAPAIEEGFGDEGELPGEEPAGASTLSVAVDKVTLIPGAIASGTVTFSDGVTGKWMIDQYGRPGFTQVSKEGYRPSPTDAQAFMTELQLAIRNLGYA
ncbi:MAG: hypothetical protein B9S27_07845 [Opitutia bacterium Tous-C8FEB]|jgi:hypothetical protein|nr:MAG: hypothetical protein B9S27_07845 [Opitutae bacterium Tous-C8FEB]